MKIIVTGATGFIGTSLCEDLGKISGYSIVPVTRSQHKEGYVLTKSFEDAPLGDVLVHLGEDPDRARVNHAGEDYYREACQNVDLLLSREYSHFIYCSSAVVYGDSGTEPYKEDMDVCQIDTYTKVKIENEKKVLAAGGTVVRLANVVGPGMAANNVLSDILSQLTKSGPITVRNGRPIRDFVWLGDVTQAFVLLIRERVPGIFNVGTGAGVSISELAQIFLASIGNIQREVKSLAASPGYSYNVVSVDKIKGKLGWEPTVTISDSVDNLVKAL